MTHKIVPLLMCLLASVAHAEEPAKPDRMQAGEIASRWGVGFNFLAIGTDQGFGLEVTTPTFGYRHLSLSMTYNNMSSSLSEDREARYNLVTLDLASRNVLTERMRAYQKLGLGLTFPRSFLASTSGSLFLAGIGLEFLSSDETLQIFRGSTFFGEVGASIPLFDMVADNVPGDPSYGRGVFAIAGYRYYF